MRKEFIWMVTASLIIAFFTSCSPLTGKSNTAYTSAAKQEDETSYENIGVIADTTADVFREPDIMSERVTQALFNQPVVMLEKNTSWTKVEVVDGYTGWIKTSTIDMDYSSIKADNYEYRIIVKDKAKTLRSQSIGGATVKEVVMGTEFFSNRKMNGAYLAALPGGETAWIDEKGTTMVEVGEEIPKTETEQFVETLLQLKGAIYLWGGVSSRGIDCSGLTYIAARVNGVTLPRDAHEQYEEGYIVSTKLIKRGDLVFFSSSTDLKDISHVGVYLGDGTFIHASKSRGYVTITPIDDTYFKERLVGVKRML